MNPVLTTTMITRSRAPYLSALDPSCPLNSEEPVNVDVMRKELIGEFKNTGREYRPAGSPVPVNVHDLHDPALGKAIPDGVYDIGANTG
jgi:hypothetical protein